MITQILQPSINLGLEEEKFWNMTLAEIERWMNGATWRLQRQAEFDYTLANLIGISNSRIMSKDAEFPKIEDIYTNLFDSSIAEKNKRIDEEQKIISSQNNFMAFAMAHNAKLRKGVETTN